MSFASLCPTLLLPAAPATLVMLRLLPALLAGLAAVPAAAQPLPLREAPIIEPEAAPADVFKPPAPTGRPVPDAVAKVYLEGCVANEGHSNAVVDWALAQGFEPVDPLRVGAEDLLSGVPGTVLAAPGSGGGVLLASTLNRRCLVWAENTNGPRLRIAFQRMVSGLGAKGARVQPMLERNLNSGGAWRNQSQWRYRRVGGSEDFGLGSATTLAGTPSTQLLHFTPLANPPPPHPDGQPSR